MKASKALKRLTKIEALMSDLTERYSASALHIRALLQDAKAAVARAKEAVALHATSGTAKTLPVNQQKAEVQTTQPKKRTISAAGRERMAEAQNKRWAAARKSMEHSIKAVSKPAAAKGATTTKLAVTKKTPTSAKKNTATAPKKTAT